MGKIFEALEKSGNQGSAGFETGSPRFSQSPLPFPEQAKPIAPDRPQQKDWGSEEVFLDFVKRVPAKEAVESKSAFGRDLPERLSPALVTAKDPKSIESEQFRLLKNNILFPEEGNPPRSIMITSPSPDEGKSFVSANLAVSIAQSIDEYVLLMDCDLRRPSIHSLFGMDNALGLSDHLSGAVPLPSLLKKTFIDKLTLLPGGSIPPNPSELLSSEQMRGLLREVKSRYSDRYVIIDTPPPQITSETNAIARVVDGIIIVVRQGVTKKKEVQDIIDIYGRKKILGVIKNFAATTPGMSYRYKKYGYRRS